MVLRPLFEFMSATASKGTLSSQIALYSLTASAVIILWRLVHPNRYSFEGKRLIIVITGCDTGFGYDASIKLARKGFLVISGCLTQEGVDRLSGIVEAAVLCDVTKEDDVARLCETCATLSQTKEAKLWAVINNAGIAPLGSTDWMQMSSIAKVMDVNYMGTVRVTKGLLPMLKKTRESRIINISSVAGLGGAQIMGAYCASKHAVEGFMKSLRDEMRPWRVRVCNINPVTTRSTM
jgi:NAD(P)-dependent dehydrogenase (short-subunit alcohol dehydrogenase family)